MRTKTTQARYYSARFNPVTSKEDAKAIEIIDRLIAEGFNFKAIATDAILRAEGVTPQMFHNSLTANAVLISRMEDLLTQFASDLIDRMGSMPRSESVDYDAIEDEEIAAPSSAFARNFAKGFMQRQQSKGD